MIQDDPRLSKMAKAGNPRTMIDIFGWFKSGDLKAIFTI
jgi:hypothetical protein